MEYHYVSPTLYHESSYGVIMTCNSCKKKIDDAIWYEAHLLCYPCYEVWDKALEKEISR